MAGDIWFLGTDGRLMVCVGAKAKAVAAGGEPWLAPLPVDISGGMG